MPPVAKHRRNRERATELITVLDGMVPAKYPYRAFSKPAEGAELSLQKRSRNMTLEDVIDAVRKALGKDSRSYKNRSDAQVSITSIMCASNEAFGVAILREDGEIVEASDGLKRMLGISYVEQKRAFIRSGEWMTDELTGISTCQVHPGGMQTWCCLIFLLALGCDCDQLVELSLYFCVCAPDSLFGLSDVLLCQMDNDSGSSTADAVRTLLVYHNSAQLQQQVREMQAMIPPTLDLPGYQPMGAAARAHTRTKGRRRITWRTAW